MMAKIITKQITFEEMMKEFKKFVGTKKNRREILKYVFYNGSHFVATDAFRLLKVNSEFISDVPTDLKAGDLYNPATNEFLNNSELKYPDTDKFIPNNYSVVYNISKSVNEIQKLIKLSNSLMTDKTKNSKRIRFTVEEDYMVIRAVQNDVIKNETIIKHNKVIESNNNENRFTLNSKFITGALVTAKKLSKLSDENLLFKMNSGLRPSVIGKENVFEILIMPIREF